MADVAFELRRRLADPVRLVEALGLTERAQRQARGLHILCPWHAERSPSCSVLEGEDGTVRVHCFGCDKSGNALHLIAARWGWNMMGDFPRVLEEAARMAGVRLEDLRREFESGPKVAPARPAAPPAGHFQATERIPRAELKALWDASGSVNATGDCTPEDLDVCRFLARRRWWPPSIAAIGCCRVLPLEHAWPTWWPASWAPIWRLAVLAFEADGTPAGIHARAVTEASPKSRWPYSGRDRKYSFSRLLFADRAGRGVLRGTPPAGLQRIVLVEGITDFLAAAYDTLETGAPHAVLGATAGGFAALEGVRWPAGVTGVIATDHDTAGEKYSAEIAKALPGVRLVRLPPPAEAAA